MTIIPRSAARLALLLTALGAACVFAPVARAQPLDMSHGGPVEITASDGIEWHQNDQTVTAIGNAHAVRGNVTVVADRLIAFYRKKAVAPGASAAVPPPAPVAARQAAPSPADDQNGGNEIFRLEAVGNVHMFTTTDQGECDKAVYDIDQGVLVMTGHALKLTTPQDVITARDAMEYWSQKHMAVARGDAVITTNDAREVSADTLVAYMTDPTAPGADAAPKAAPTPPPPTGAKAGNPQDDPLAASGKLQRVEAFGDVVIRTTTQTVIGDRGVYVPDTGIARMAGATKLTQGQNQVNGEGLEVNLNTGVYRLISQAGERVHGLVMPNDSAGGTAPGAPRGNTDGSGKSAAPRKGTP